MILSRTYHSAWVQSRCSVHHWWIYSNLEKSFGGKSEEKEGYFTSSLSLGFYPSQQRPQMKGSGHWHGCISVGSQALWLGQATVEQWKWKWSRSVMSYFLQSHGLYSLPGSSVHGILQARILEWVAMPSSRGSSQPRDGTQVSCVAGECFYYLSHHGSLKQIILILASRAEAFPLRSQQKKSGLSCLQQHHFVLVTASPVVLLTNFPKDAIHQLHTLMFFLSSPI